VNGESRIVKSIEPVSKSPKASTFEDLQVYEVARDFRKTMYRVAGELPEIDKFGLASRIRRSAL